MKEVVFVLILGTVGLLLAVMGVLIRTGQYKRWYLVDENSIFYHKAAFYGFIPWGLALIFLSVLPFLPTGGALQDLVVYVFFSLGGIGVLLTFWQPWWLKPSWVHYLEEKHTDILNLIIQEARETPGWEQLVSSQVNMERWAAEIRQKHGLPSRAESTVEIRRRSWLRRKWPVGLAVVGISSGLGQYLLGSGFLGFIGGWAILGLIYLLQQRE